MAWQRIKQRVGNKDGQHPTYINVELRMTREEFYEWYKPRWFPGATVDRIDNDGHYELSNLQLLTRSENSKKNSYNYNAPEGMSWCSGWCKDYRPSDLFWPADPKRCKECRNRYKREHRQRVRERGGIPS